MNPLALGALEAADHALRMAAENDPGSIYCAGAALRHIAALPDHGEYPGRRSSDWAVQVALDLSERALRAVAGRRS